MKMTSRYGAVDCMSGFNLPGLDHFPLTPNGRVPNSRIRTNVSLETARSSRQTDFSTFSVDFCRRRGMSRVLTMQHWRSLCFMHIDKTGQVPGKMHEHNPHEESSKLFIHETVDYCGRRGLSRGSQCPIPACRMSNIDAIYLEQFSIGQELGYVYTSPSNGVVGQDDFMSDFRPIHARRIGGFNAVQFVHFSTF
jgi:hypothetical protein